MDPSVKLRNRTWLIFRRPPCDHPPQFWLYPCSSIREVNMILNFGLIIPLLLFMVLSTKCISLKVFNFAYSSSWNPYKHTTWLFYDWLILLCFLLFLRLIHNYVLSCHSLVFTAVLSILYKSFFFWFNIWVVFKVLQIMPLWTFLYVFPRACVCYPKIHNHKIAGSYSPLLHYAKLFFKVVLIYFPTSVDEFPLACFLSWYCPNCNFYQSHY